MPLARSSIIRHKSGVSLRTPILIPSFSSKGFKFKKRKKGIKNSEFFQTKFELSEKKNKTRGCLSEVTDIITGTAEVLTDSMLVSAYDIFHQHIPLPYNKIFPEIIFIDSGGYEVGDTYDYSEVMQVSGEPNEWEVEYYREVLDAWPEHIPAVFTSFDCKCRGKPLSEQIGLAHDFFSRYRKNQLCSMLVKPVSEESTFKKTMYQIQDKLDLLGCFDILGFAEKDLGNSALTIMENIGKIRFALDEAKLNVPIHIFGSLDPITTCLYFLAGAELFDGLTWLRYGYLDGRAVYYRNSGLIRLGVHEKEGLVRAHNINSNVYYLRDLEQEMLEYLLDHEFDRFKYNGSFLRKAFNRLRSKFEGRQI